TPAPEPALGMDDLACEPRGLVGYEPRDKARRVVRLSVSPEREHGLHELPHVVGEIPGVDGAWIDGIHPNVVVGELIGDRRRHSGNRGLGCCICDLGPMPGEVAYAAAKAAIAG